MVKRLTESLYTTFINSKHSVKVLPVFIQNLIFSRSSKVAIVKKFYSIAEHIPETFTKIRVQLLPRPVAGFYDGLFGREVNPSN
ncbi:hypothetical protein PGB90_003766 [Kerria lacca]